MLHLEIVVESAGHRRPEGQLHAVEQPHHRPGHDVRTRMAQQIQGLGVFAGDQAKGDLAVGGQRLVGPHQPAVHFGGQSGLGQTRTDVGGNVDRSNATRILEGLSVGEGDFQHGLQRASEQPKEMRGFSRPAVARRPPAWMGAHFDSGPKNNPPASGASIQRTPRGFAPVELPRLSIGCRGPMSQGHRGQPAARLLRGWPRIARLSGPRQRQEDSARPLVAPPPR